VVKRKHR